MTNVEEIESLPGPTVRARIDAEFVEPSIPGGARGSRRLRALLVGSDSVGTFAAWILAFAVNGAGTATLRSARPLETSALITAGTLLLLSQFEMYRSRVCVVRTVEMARLAQVTVVPVLLLALLSKTASWSPPPRVDLLGGTYSFLFVAAMRSGYGSWLKTSRARGLYCRSVSILGANDDASALVKLLTDHPELGYRVAAVLGAPSDWVTPRAPIGFPSANADLPSAVRRTGAAGVMIAANAVDSKDLDDVVRQLTAAGLHVQISTGMSRIGQQRIRVNPLSGQLLFYVEARRLSSRQLILKRALDLSVACVLMLITAPVLLAAALAIKLDDRGPIFYRQERVGRNGTTFQVIKLRTMVPDACIQLASLSNLNERRGPLFKLNEDPRVTRVGRFLRGSSVDELPQLFNVLRGEMSLVGPRPALLAEDAQFDENLRERSSVLPGITGLWQVEARDNPSFDAYRRLDLFYVDNWTVVMDIMILFATCGVVLRRAVGSLRGSGEMNGRPFDQDDDSAAPTLMSRGGIHPLG